MGPLELAAGFARYERAAAYYARMYRDRPDREHYLRIARRAEGHVLELGCGDGRLLETLARNGLQVTGLDVSRHMVALARRRIANLPPPDRRRASVVQGDVRDFDLAQYFGAALLPFRLLQHLLAPQDRRDCLDAVRRHVRTSGLLAFDVFRARPETGPFPRPWREDPLIKFEDGTRVQRRYRKLSYAPEVSNYRIEVRFEEYRRGDDRATQWRYVYGLHTYDRSEIDELLARSDFEMVQYRTDFGAQVEGTSGWNHVVVARAIGDR